MKAFLKNLILLFAITFISCTQTQQTNYSISIKGHQWKSFDKYEMSIKVYENGNYNLYTLFRHNLKYPYTKFEGQLSLIQAATKDSLHFKIDINLVDTAGKWAGDMLDDLVSHEIILKQNIVRRIS